MRISFKHILNVLLILVYGCIENNNPYLNHEVEYSSIEIGEVRDLFISDSTLFVGTESEGLYIYNINGQSNDLELLYTNLEWGIRKDIRSVHFDANTQIVYALDRFDAIYHGYYPFLISNNMDTLVSINGGQCNVSFKNATKFFINNDSEYPEIFALYKRNSDNELYLEESFSSMLRISYLFDPVLDFEFLGDAFTDCTDDLLNIEDSLSYEINDFHFNNTKFYLGDDSNLKVYSYQGGLDTSIVLDSEIKSVYSMNDFLLAGVDNGCYITLLPNNSNDNNNNNILHIAEGFTIYDIFYDDNKLILSAGAKGVLIYDWDGNSFDFNFSSRLLSSYAFTARIYNGMILVASKNGLEIFN